MSMVLLTTAAMLCGMVGNPEPPEQNKKTDHLGLLYGLCNIHCTTFTVFLHYGFGSEALGFPGLFALILIFFSMAGDALMAYWLMAFLVALVIQRFITFTLLRRGHELHSRYAGRPWLAKLLPFLKDKNAIALEAVLCFVVGAVMLSVSPFIGKYLIVGCFSLILRSAIEESVFKRRLQQMRDAEMEQRWLSERFRGRGDDY